MVDDSLVDGRSATTPDATGTRHAWHAIDQALPRPRTLWSLAVLAMVLDVAITGVGLSLGLTERNLIARVVIDAVGLVGAGVLLKGAVLALGYACWRLIPHLVSESADPLRNLVPIGVAIPSWIAVGINTSLVLSIL